MGSCAAPSAKGDDKFITTDYLQQCRFRDTYGLSVIPVSVDGVINPLLPDSRTDQGQAQRLGVKYFPAMMLVDPKQGSIRPLSYGFISQDDLAKQFLNVSEDFKPNF